MASIPQTGDPLPDLTRHLGAAELVAYAGATWDWHRNHYDAGLARQKGLRAPIVDGQMLGALLAVHARSPFGSSARVRRMAFRHRGLVFCGDDVQITGSVTKVVEQRESRSFVISQEMSVDGRAVLASATTVVELPATGLST